MPMVCTNAPARILVGLLDLIREANRSPEIIATVGQRHGEKQNPLCISLCLCGPNQITHSPPAPPRNANAPESAPQRQKIMAVPPAPPIEADLDDPFHPPGPGRHDH